jgi:hypothetical protein
VRPNGAVERFSDDRNAGRGEPVVESLRVMDAQPQRHAESGLSTIEIGFGQRIPDRNRDRSHS